jgi:DNA-directed RNA polymerase subunit RPC12/RpoP
MTARNTRFKCLNCKHEYDGVYDPDKVTERTCPQCRSNSVRRLPEKKAAARK